MGVAVIGVMFFGLLAGRADSVSAQVAPQLAPRLTAAGVPQFVMGAVVDGFRVCFHDRAAATDPTAEPASCRDLRQRSQGHPGSAAVQAAFADAARAAVGRDFTESMEWSLLYEMGVFATTLLLVVLLPAVRPQHPH